MCRERYALECPFGLPKAQLPPTRSEPSNCVYGMPWSATFLAAVRPLIPAPMIAVVGSIDEDCPSSDGVAGEGPQRLELVGEDAGPDRGVSLHQLARALEVRRED